MGQVFVAMCRLKTLESLSILGSVVRTKFQANLDALDEMERMRNTPALPLEDFVEVSNVPRTRHTNVVGDELLRGNQSF